MDIHNNARLTPHGREHMVTMVLSGQTPEVVREVVSVALGLVFENRKAER